MGFLMVGSGFTGFHRSFRVSLAGELPTRRVFPFLLFLLLLLSLDGFYPGRIGF